MPFADRFAYVWMWHHGGWDIVPSMPPRPEASGVGEPLYPKPSPPATQLAGTVEDD
jgi:hypothetical protein